MGMGRRLIIVDDEPIIRGLLTGRLKDLGFEAWPAASALEAKRLVEQVDPDAMIVDIDLREGASGTELVIAMSQTHPGMSFLLLSNFMPTEGQLRGLSKVAYLSKRDVADIDVLVASLERVLRNPQDAEVSAIPSAFDQLTPTQLEVLTLIARGLTNQEIANQRGGTLRATEQTISRLYRVLGIDRDGAHSARVQAARIFASQAGSTRWYPQD